MTFEPFVTQKMRILGRKTALQYGRCGGEAGSVILSRCYTIQYCTVVALASVQTAEMSMMLCYVLFICKRYAARTNNGVFPLRKERNKK